MTCAVHLNRCTLLIVDVKRDYLMLNLQNINQLLFIKSNISQNNCYHIKCCCTEGTSLTMFISNRMYCGSITINFIIIGYKKGIVYNRIVDWVIRSLPDRPRLRIVWVADLWAFTVWKLWDLSLMPQGAMHLPRAYVNRSSADYTIIPFLCSKPLS